MAAIPTPDTQYWQLSIGGYGTTVTGLDDIRQCIFVILSTIKGTDTLRPEFGCDIWELIDKPQNYQIPRVVRAIYDAVELWEPRAKITSITPAPSPDGKVIYTITWTSVLGNGQNIIPL